MSLATSNVPHFDEGPENAVEDSAKRRQILEGARRIFVTVGFDAASMNDITREAGVSKSTLYVYFRSKEELFVALMDEERERHFAAAREILDDETRPAEVLRTVGLRLAAKMLSPEAVLAKRTIIAVASRMPNLGRDFFRRGPQRGHALIRDYLERAVAAGCLRIDDVDLAANQFIELATAGLLRCRLFDDEAPEPTQQEIDHTVDAAVALFMAGYGTPTEASARAS